MNTARVEREPEEIKETKGSLHAVGVIFAEKIYWHAGLVLSHHSKTHTRSHTHWHNGHAATLLPVSLNNEREGNTTALHNRHRCCCRAGPAESMTKQISENLFTLSINIEHFSCAHFLHTFDLLVLQGKHTFTWFILYVA